jgi:DNA-binding response OmpR family regulator
VKLPDGNGLDILRRIQKLYPIRGIVLSGCGLPSDVQASLGAGYARHITKPVEFATLLTHVREVLAGEAPGTQ